MFRVSSRLAAWLTSLQSPGQLPADEAIKGHIVVERPDHEIEEVLDIGIVQIMLKTSTLGKSHHVQSLAARSLAHMWIGQQAIHHPGPRSRMPVGEKTKPLTEFRGQSPDFETVSPKQEFDRGRFRQLQPLLFPSPQDEPVDRVSRPVTVPDI